MHGRTFICIVYLICATLGGVAQISYEPDDTLPDVTLREVQIETRRKLPVMKLGREHGDFRLGSEALSNSAHFLGAPDPVRVMQSLPYVASSDCISGGIYVQGSENSHNMVEIDGVQIFNPMHLLGLFSVFNTSHFESFDINFGKDFAVQPNFVGADISANTSWRHPSRIGGDFSVGLIDSRCTLRLPVDTDKSSLALSARGTYVNALFGDAIRVENAPLHYGFCDFNATYLQSLPSGWKVKVNGYYGRDNMNVNDPNYSSDITMGWSNLVVGAAFRQSDKQLHTVGYSRFANKVLFNYTDADHDIPSSIYSTAYSGQGKIGLFRLGSGLAYKRVSPQYSSKAGADSLYSASSLEAYAGAEIDIVMADHLCVTPGCKVACYTARNFSKIYGLPALSAKYDLTDLISVAAMASRRAQFLHKVEESTIGLPTDFWIAADCRYKPCLSTDLSLSLQGTANDSKYTYYIGAYYRSFDNLCDWMGNLFSMLGSNYEPLSDVVTGKGKACGLAAMLKANIGSVQGWISYTLSKSQQKYPLLGNVWYPYSHDRTHDLKINAAWRIARSITLSASFVYATGYPYTEPLYGYMLGENLIFEFKEHNSSRLPSMHRLDLGLNWHFCQSGRFSHSINVGVFNAYGHENVMFKSFKYHPDNGIQPTCWSMDYVLPSVSYNIKF